MNYILSKISSIRTNATLTAVQASNIFLSFHYYLLIYINSSYLSQFFSSSQVSLLYIIGAAVELAFLFVITDIIKKIGTYKLTIYSIFIECIAIFGMTVSTNKPLLALCFMLQLLCIPLISFTLDLFLESVLSNESQTGSIRATYMTLSNATLIICPTLVGFILTHAQYPAVYGLSLLFLLPLYIYIRSYFKDFKDTTRPKRVGIKETILAYVHDKDLGYIFSSCFILQLFYAYMVVYIPIYLSQYIGFSWSEIGIMLTIILLPFILIELPAGSLADKMYGEKEMLTIGLVIMGLSTLALSFITTKSFITWTAVLFVTRVGAALVEITTDSYFFKHVDQTKVSIIALYRSCRPLSFIMAPILVIISLHYGAYNFIFLPLALLIILGTKWSVALHDTK